MPDAPLRRPQFSLEEARAVLREHYGRAGALKELSSERDQNFYLQSDEGAGYVLKIANAAEKRETLEFQIAAIRHLSREVSGFDWPRVQKTVGGEDLALVSRRDGSGHYVRLMTYLPGRFLAEVKPHSSDLLRSLGRFLGTMDKALASFHHPSAERDLKWNLKRAPETVRRLLSQVGEPESRSLILHFLERFEEKAAPLLPKLRTSVIHNDANDHNVLVGSAAPQPSGRWARVKGIIDFGDMLEGPPCVEAAVGAAYAMLNKSDPLAAAAPIVSGYHEVLPLQELELGVLFDLIVMRLCLSVVISAEQQKQETGNPYLTISEKPAWDLLRRLRGASPDFAHYVFRQACAYSPCPQNPGLVSWLRGNRDKYGPVLEVSLKETPPLILDLSVGSAELSGWNESDGMEALERLLFSRLSTVKAKVAVGRYDEVRRFYTSSLFEQAGNDSPEWRTLHLGLDLFAAPGTRVFAPLEGTVHSFGINSAERDYGPTVILEHTPAEGIKFHTLYGHLERASLDGLERGRPLKRGEVLGRIGTRLENGGWPAHLHFQVITDLLGHEGDFPGVALPSQREVWLSLSPDPGMLLQIPESPPREKSPTRRPEELLDLRRRHLGFNLSISYRRPLKIVRGLGTLLYDENGQEYLDAVNNVPHVGHCHPRVVRAVQEQAAILNTNTRYLHDRLVEYALRLGALLPEPLRVFYFVCSGSEANDLALRLAWRHTGRKDVIVIDGAYHGNLSSLIGISPYKFDGPGGEGAPPHVHKVMTPDGFRGPHKYGDPAAGLKYAGHVEAAVAACGAMDAGPAAFICESLMGSAGQIVYPPGFLAEAFRQVRMAGGVCIADEVQVGFGRVGSRFWGFETQGVVPDIVTMGKPIGNGHPLAAVVTTPDIAASFNNGMEYFNTFGGNPVSCAAGLAVLDVLREENLQENARGVGGYLKAGLEGLKSRHALIGDIRGLGLFLGVELVLDRKTLEPATAEAAHAAERMKEKRVLVSTDGPYRNVLKIKPPLVFSRRDAGRLLAALDEVLGEDALSCGGSSPEIV